jgi:hypothetical protein
VESTDSELVSIQILKLSHKNYTSAEGSIMQYSKVLNKGKKYSLTVYEVFL